MCDRIISLKGEVWAHETSLILPPFIKVPVPSRENVNVASFCNSSFGF